MGQRQCLGLRSFVASAELPWLVLVVDEFNSFELSADAKWKREVKAALSALLSQGRSAGIVVLVAAQQGQREAIGPYRDHFVTRIALRISSQVETDVILGAGLSNMELCPMRYLLPPFLTAIGLAGVGTVCLSSNLALFVSERYSCRTKIFGSGMNPIKERIGK